MLCYAMSPFLRRLLHRYAQAAIKKENGTSDPAPCTSSAGSITKEDLLAISSLITMNQTETTAALDAITTQVRTATAAIKTAVEALTATTAVLQDAVQNGPVSDALAAAVTNLQTVVTDLEAAIPVAAPAIA